MKISSEKRLFVFFLLSCQLEFKCVGHIIGDRSIVTDQYYLPPSLHTQSDYYSVLTSYPASEIFEHYCGVPGSPLPTLPEQQLKCLTYWSLLTNNWLRARTRPTIPDQ